MQTKSVLLIESDPDEAERIGAMFNEQGLYSFELTHAESMEQAEVYLDLHSVSVVLLDVGGFLGDSCLAAMRRTQAVAPRASLVLLTDPEDETIALRAMDDDLGTQELHVTASISISVYPDDGLDTETLIKNVRSLSGLSRRDEGVRWQHVLPGQFR